MKHEKEIDNFFREVLFEDWMSEEDYDKLFAILIEQSGMDKKAFYQQLNDDIEVGITNGHSVETQLKLAKSIFKK